MLSWDTVMGATCSSVTKLESAHQIKFHKVLKVIFEVTENKNFHLASDNPMDWKWGGLDLCCPPLRSNGATSNDSANNASTLDMITNMNAQTKTTSVRICLSIREWDDVKQSLMQNSQFFSESVRDAVVMTKLGVMPENGSIEHSAMLSFLPIVI
jgi:hypothetical protein